MASSDALRNSHHAVKLPEILDSLLDFTLRVFDRLPGVLGLRKGECLFAQWGPQRPSTTRKHAEGGTERGGRLEKRGVSRAARKI